MPTMPIVVLIRKRPTVPGGVADLSLQHFVREGDRLAEIAQDIGDALADGFVGHGAIASWRRLDDGLVDIVVEGEHLLG